MISRSYPSLFLGAAVAAAAVVGAEATCRCFPGVSYDAARCDEIRGN